MFNSFMLNVASPFIFQSLRGVFAALEGNISSLISAWKPLWKAHCQSKNIPIKKWKKGGGWGRMKSRLKGHRGDGDGMSLPETARELLISITEAGYDIEVCRTRVLQYSA